MKKRRKCVVVVAGVLIVVALTVDLDGFPPLWWDEGFTLSVARNWVELGHYGRVLNGELVPRGLEAAFPLTGSVALSFQLFGVGIYQARLVSVVFAMAALGLYYALSRQFYNRSIAIAALAVHILMGGRADSDTIIAARQVLGEIPALIFLLTGYLYFISAEKRPLVLMPVVSVFWSLAILSKLQVLPFFLAALGFPLLVTLYHRRWKSARLFGGCLIGSMILKLGFDYFLARIWPVSTVTGLTPLLALVFLPDTRLTVMVETLQYGLPTLLGLCWGLWSFLRTKNGIKSHIDLVRFSFLVLAGSWFGWFVFLSIGWARYMFPPVFLGSVFVAAMLDEWTNHFNLKHTFEQAVSVLKKLQFHWHKLAALTATVLVALSLGQSVGIFLGAYVLESDNSSDSSIHDTIQFLNTVTPPNALIETFESELLFLLHRRYHYPPDQVHVELIRRLTFDHRLKIDYDPLAANPDYLVVGHQSKYMGLYDPYLNTGAFRLTKKFSRYDIYERVR
jgi:hypothetical protein